MSFVCKQVSADRWGIYSGTRLLATVSDRETCEVIMANFESGRTKVPSNQASATDASQSAANFSTSLADTVKTPVVETTSEQSEQTATAGTEAAAVENNSSAVSMSDEDLAKVLNVKSLKVKELESAVLRAQMGQKGQR